MHRNQGVNSADSESGLTTLTTSLWDDFRVAARILRSTPLVAAVAILSLALGTGATTALVSILNGLLLRNLPISEPQRLAVVSTTPDANRGAAWLFILEEEALDQAGVAEIDPKRLVKPVLAPHRARVVVA